ncbi:MULTISPECIES: hypothetical protein [unclassified Endozoicomonas]|uniref:hypothetical protein n=1 Tax=unclassified Endozoicomonas TaxID=2644528 RepID=UPI003BB5B3EF
MVGGDGQQRLNANVLIANTFSLGLINLMMHKTPKHKPADIDQNNDLSHQEGKMNK